MISLADRQSPSPNELPFRSSPDPDHRRQLVLVAEDEHHDWLIYGKLLWYNGYDVLHAQDGEAGLRLAREHHPDLVLADLMLPVMDGLELTRALKEDPATEHVPVVMLSARRESEYGDCARRAGCIRYLEKPIGPVEVLHTIESIVGRPPPPVD